MEREALAAYARGSLGALALTPGTSAPHDLAALALRSAALAACEAQVSALARLCTSLAEADAAVASADSADDGGSRLACLAAAADALQGASAASRGAALCGRLRDAADARLSACAAAVLAACQSELGLRLAQAGWPPGGALADVEALAAWRPPPGAVAAAALLDSLPPVCDPAPGEDEPVASRSRSSCVLAAPLAVRLVAHAPTLAPRPAWLFAAALRVADAAAAPCCALSPGGGCWVVAGALSRACALVLSTHTLPQLEAEGVSPPAPQRWLALAEEARGFDEQVLDRGAPPRALAALAHCPVHAERWAAAELEAALRALDAAEAGPGGGWEGPLPGVAAATLAQLDLLLCATALLAQRGRAAFCDRTAARLCDALLRRAARRADAAAAFGQLCSRAGASAAAGCACAAAAVGEGARAGAARCAAAGDAAAAAALDAAAARLEAFSAEWLAATGEALAEQAAGEAGRVLRSGGGASQCSQPHHVLYDLPVRAAADALRPLRAQTGRLQFARLWRAARGRLLGALAEELRHETRCDSDESRHAAAEAVRRVHAAVFDAAT